jgi:hypothetical protein
LLAYRFLRLGAKRRLKSKVANAGLQPGEQCVVGADGRALVLARHQNDP